MRRALVGVVVGLCAAFVLSCAIIFIGSSSAYSLPTLLREEPCEDPSASSESAPSGPTISAWPPFEVQNLDWVLADFGGVLVSAYQRPGEDAVRVVLAAKLGGMWFLSSAISCCVSETVDSECFHGQYVHTPIGEEHEDLGWEFGSAVGACNFTYGTPSGTNVSYVHLMVEEHPDEPKSTSIIKVRKLFNPRGQTVMCVKPIFRDGLQPGQPSFREWFHYHRLIGVDAFSIYVQDVLESNVAMLREVVHEGRAGRAEIIDFSQGKAWPMIHGGQVLSHCSQLTLLEPEHARLFVSKLSSRVHLVHGP